MVAVVGSEVVARAAGEDKVVVEPTEATEATGEMRSGLHQTRHSHQRSE